MAAVRSAGVLLFRRRDGRIEVLLGHMGGPFWHHRDDGAWTIPKGECEPGESDLDVALREFREETGSDVPHSKLVDLGDVEQSRQKVVHVWAAEGDLDAASATSTTFEMEWPRGSGQMQSYPEIDRVEWFDITTARRKVIRGQVVTLDRLAERLD